MSEGNGKAIQKDLLSSLVVFLVALPLCMGIAIASGVHPAAGLITGIIGGIVVGSLSGSPLQVSGPAAGLAVIIWEIISKHGLPALGAIIVVAGITQIAFGALKLGRIFRAVSPAVVQGMLSGIGVLIFASQFHVMLDDKPLGSGIDNLMAIPKILGDVITMNHDFNHLAALIGLITIAIVVLWDKLPFDKLRNAVPPTLLAVLATTALAAVMGLDVKRVELPNNITDAIKWLDLSIIPTMGWTILTQGMIVAFIASAETLLSANAIDRMAPENKAKYDKELVAQGVGNTLCGIVGALPLTGVIVRSSVNVKAGAKSRFSAIFHGVWLLLFVAAFPFALKMIPTAVLAALLVYTGWKLLDIKSIQAIGKQSRTELLILLATMVTIVCVDLLTGVLTGVVLSVAKLVYAMCRLHINKVVSDNQVILELRGAATFLNLPQLAEEIEKLPHDTDLHLDVSNLLYIDHACLELIKTQEKQFKTKSGDITIDWGPDQAKFKKSVSRMRDVEVGAETTSVAA